jgi:phosphocarrier protein HPr
MKKEKAIVQNRNGMHLRVVGQVVEAAKRFNVDITICKGCETADGCSILQLLMLAASEGCELEITVEGDREHDAMDELKGLFSDGGGI